MNPDDIDEIERVFTYHPPRPGQVDIYEVLRRKAKTFAYHVLELVPHSDERAEAVKRIRESVMWANAALVTAEVLAPEPESDHDSPLA